MRTIWLIAKHDWRMLRAERTLWAIGLLLAITIGYGVRNGSTWVDFQRRTIEGALSEERERISRIQRDIVDLNAGRKQASSWSDPRSPFAAGYTLAARWAVMPPAPLSPLAIGQSDLLPYYFKVSLRSRDTLIGNDEIENPVHLLSGRFDLAFVIIYLYPLVILAFGFNLISGDKEDGTLAMTLSQPVRLRTLAAGRILFRGLYVLTLATVLSIAGALLAGVDFTAEGAGVRMLLWTAVVAAYGAFWFALAVAANALGKSSAANAVALAGAWLLLVLLVPSLLNVTIKSLHPVPSRVEMIQAMRVASDEVTAQRSKLMAKYLEDHPELVGASQDTMAKLAVRNVAMMERMEDLVQPVLDRFDRQLKLQQSLVERYRFLSPAILTQAALYDLAGTDALRYQHFTKLVDSFHKEWRSFFFPLMLKNVKLTEQDAAGMPQFRFLEESSAAVAGRTLGSITALALLAAAMMAAAQHGLTRYRIPG